MITRDWAEPCLPCVHGSLQRAPGAWASSPAASVGSSFLGDTPPSLRQQREMLKAE